MSNTEYVIIGCVIGVAVEVILLIYVFRYCDNLVKAKEAKAKLISKVFENKNILQTLRDVLPDGKTIYVFHRDSNFIAYKWHEKYFATFSSGYIYEIRPKLIGKGVRSLFTEESSEIENLLINSNRSVSSDGKITLS